MLLTAAATSATPARHCGPGDADGGAVDGHDRRRRLAQLAHVAVALDGAYHALAIGWNLAGAHVARPRVVHMGYRIGIVGVSRAQCHALLSLEILLAPLPCGRATANRKHEGTCQERAGQKPSHLDLTA